jgi:hypothetical protein
MFSKGTGQPGKVPTQATGKCKASASDSEMFIGSVVDLVTVEYVCPHCGDSRSGDLNSPIPTVY